MRYLAHGIYVADVSFLLKELCLVSIDEVKLVSNKQDHCTDDNLFKPSI